MNKGRRIIIEGMDGTGKSTVVQALKEAIPNSISHAFPSHTHACGQLIRKCFTGEVKIHPAAMLHLFTADAIDAESDMQRITDQGIDLVLDRHTTVSAWAYQAEVHSIDRIDAVTISHAFDESYATFILDVTPEEALRRLRARKGKTEDVLYEKDDVEYVSRLRTRYFAYSLMHERTMIVDAAKSTEEIVDSILSVLGQYARLDLAHAMEEVSYGP